ncbi:3-deoxy-D-manno-octulosonic acid transferase [Saccharicrinis sp. FJH62]|uniref:3-deoxy-D-manno-octulosonic acid transferase n=1 Tax=Saccharicrinis sp. FJH62 TaxID=3344657 RepID=UPI0035D3ED85
MRILYSLGIALFRFFLVLLSPFNPKLKGMIAGRKNWKDKLTAGIDPNGQYIWFHCSSLGEFEQGRPLIEAYKMSHPGKKIVLTFFSPSGYEVRKNYPGADLILYLPFDTKSNVKFFLDTVKPEKAVFVKYDYWFWFLTGLKKRAVPTYLVSAIFRENQLFFKWYGGWYRNMLKQFTTIFVQTNDSVKLLESIETENVIKAGDTRFDRVTSLPESQFSDPLLETFAKDSKVVVCGSTWPPDEELISQYIREEVKDRYVKLIIAPHEIHDKHIQQIQERLEGIPVCRYTDPGKVNVSESRVMIVDTIGKLSYIYRYGVLSYIGGGFGVGIHNTLEAAVYDLPVIFGPNYLKFNEACDLINLNAAFSIANYNDLKLKLDQLLHDPERCKKTGKVAGNYVRENAGATQTILQTI